MSAFPPVVGHLDRTVCGVVIAADGVVRRILASGNRYGCAVNVLVMVDTVVL
jgi:hypothetical protein